MEDFYINDTSGDKSYGYISFMNDDYTNITSYNDDQSSVEVFIWSMRVLEWIIICTGLPSTLVAIAAVSVQAENVAPVYVINLLISDLIQLCCLAAWRAGHINNIISCFHYFGVMASVGFMMCISLDRYLMITRPLWYRFRRNITTSVVVCVVVWMLPLVHVLAIYFEIDFQLTETIFAVFLLLPLPLFIFFLVGTVKALSAAHSVPADEKRRTVAVLVLVLLIYSLMFLPTIICYLVEEVGKNIDFLYASFVLLYISPLADLTLYVFIRKGISDRLLAALCCC